MIISVQNWPRPLRAATTVLLVLFVALVDLGTGDELSFFVFYFVPVSFAAWNLSLSWAIGTALLCTVGWLGVEALSGHQYSHPALLVANTFVRCISYIVMAWFFSRLKQSRVELRNYADQLETKVAQRTAKLQERVGELETFSYSVSHNLRAPLRAMEGMAHAIEDSLASHSLNEIPPFLDRIKSAAHRMDRLILDLVDYVQLTIREPEICPVPIGPLLTEVIDVHRQMIQSKNAEIIVECEMLTVWGHNRILFNVLCQLVSNALKFSSPSRPPQITIYSSHPRAGWVRLSLRDNGIGIPQRYQERIFGLFEQLDPSHELHAGTGMGLAIARKCLEKMDGKIGLHSDGLQGATFWFELKEYQPQKPISQSPG